MVGMKEILAALVVPEAVEESVVTELVVLVVQQLQDKDMPVEQEVEEVLTLTAVAVAEEEQQVLVEPAKPQGITTEEMEVQEQLLLLQVPLHTMQVVAVVIQTVEQ